MGMMIMGIVVPRFEIDLINKAGDWILIYGRRKTGKSYLVRKFVEFDRYYFVSRSGKIFRLTNDHFTFIAKEVFYEAIQRDLLEEKTVVIDEFHRLSEDLQDLLQALKPSSKARLILITSSLFYVEKIFGPKSPLLGIVTPIKIGVIQPRNILLALSNHIRDVETLLQMAPFAREPLLLNIIRDNQLIDDFLVRLSLVIKDVVPALIGEIFFEEGRELTRRYEAIIKAIAVGNHTPAKIASYISGITSESLSSSDVKSYLKLLEKMGIVSRVGIHRKNRYLYKIQSPMIWAHYYLDEKLGYGEQETPLGLITKEIRKLLPIFYEDFIIEFIAEILGGTVEKILKNEVDGIIKRKREAIAAIEVKMGSITEYEAKKFREKLKNHNLDIPAIVVAKNKIREPKIVSLTPKDIVEIAKDPEKLRKSLH